MNTSKTFLSLRFLFLIVFLVSNPALSAGYHSQLTVTVIHGSDLVYFGTDKQPAGTCSYWRRYFVIDTRTSGGKTMMSMLLLAKSTGAKIDVWFNESPTPDTDQSTGCTSGNVSMLTNIGFP